jgi:hypothetical protein
MVDGASAAPWLADLDAMIRRTEIACERYRHAAEVTGLSQPVVGRRRLRWRQMEDVLAELRARRAVSERQPGSKARRRNDR